ncbi:BlaI/MecI/CopY family transcriptional regulator [Alteromonas sediminis]|uniref:BlaI/MecI/CopY family transcriptional regulator n=1 Tax=Alteromonas sediminis TaxID=2259342 RepID=A0A3N5YMN2_9ALTE|nr:BlaI/MecI/CopY family transcriptional regulator [Alteromonas sediminis]RPJ66711.1 BlaI/MecI/CopY family transcriptional regulator [Alteromonas sediminis]
MDISKTELDVMQVIWDNAPATAEEIIQRLNKDKEWHEKTVKTLLNRLVKKGALSFNKVGRVYEYYPLVSQQTYQEEETQSFIQRLFRGRLSPLVAGFAKKEELSKEDIAALKKLIEQWEQKND